MRAPVAIVAACLTVRLAVADDGAAAPVRVRLVAIVSTRSAITTITTGDLRRTFLGGITRWPDGHRTLPVVLRSDTVAQKTFLRRVVQMTDIDYAQHWIGEVFQGRASAPPRVARSAVEALRFVAGHPDAIGIIDADAMDGSVRALTINGRATDAVDYPLAW